MVVGQSFIYECGSGVVKDSLEEVKFVNGGLALLCHVCSAMSTFMVSNP